MTLREPGGDRVHAAIVSTLYSISISAVNWSEALAKLKKKSSIMSAEKLATILPESMLYLSIGSGRADRYSGEKLPCSLPWRSRLSRPRMQTRCGCLDNRQDLDALSHWREDRNASLAPASSASRFIPRLPIPPAPAAPQLPSQRIDLGHQLRVVRLVYCGLKGLHIKRSIRLEFAALHRVEIRKPLLVDDRNQLFLRQRLSLHCLGVEFSVADEHRRPALNSARQFGRSEQHPHHSQLIASSPNAPITPPVTELSSR